MELPNSSSLWSWVHKGITEKELVSLPETALEAKRGRQKDMASPIPLPYILPPGPQTKQNQGKGNLGKADHTVSSLWYQVEQGKGREWTESREATDWHDPLRQGFLIPNLQMGIFKKQNLEA